MKILRQTIPPLLVLALGVAGCGQQGPLYLPSEAKDIVTRPSTSSAPSTPPPAEPTPAPGESTERPNSPSTVDSPVSNPPAPEVTAPEGTPDAKKTDPKKPDPSKTGATPPK